MKTDRRHIRISAFAAVSAAVIGGAVLLSGKVSTVYGLEDDMMATSSEAVSVSAELEDSIIIDSAEEIYTDTPWIIIPEPEPVEGCRFIGWNTCEDGGGDWYFPGDEYEMTGHEDFYAVWEELPEAVTVSDYRKASLSEYIKTETAASESDYVKSDKNSEAETEDLSVEVQNNEE